MFEYKVKKNLSLGLLCYLIFLITLAFFSQHIDFDFSICTNSSNTTDFTNTTNTTNIDLDLCPCENILLTINIFNNLTLILGSITTIFLIVLINNKTQNIQCSNFGILLLILYFSSVIIMGSMIIIRMLMTDCMTPIQNENTLYFIGFIGHYLVVMILVIFGFIENKYIKSLLNCSCFLSKPNYNINNDIENNQNITDINDTTVLLRKEQPPAYHI
jgi:hypothetical protein